MADGIKARIGAVWKDLTPNIKVGGAWKAPDYVHIKVAGVWKQVWANIVVTLSGETVDAFSFGSDAKAEIIVDNDGKVYKRTNNGSKVQIDTGTDWIRPVSAAPDDYECRYTGLTGDALDAATSAAQNTWRALTTDYFFVQTDSTTGAGGKSSTFTIEIRKGSSGSAIASASFTLTADREDF